MDLKLFGDTQKIDWPALGVSMPFAPMHELGTKYQLTEVKENYIPVLEINVDALGRVFETDINVPDGRELFKRVKYRANNTVGALDKATSDTLCINLGGGYHHAGKYPNMGYAYSLINDIIWAVDYQLEQGKTVGIIDLDFHFGGGTFEYYRTNLDVCSYDYHHPKGILRQNSDLASNFLFHNYTSEKLYSQNPRLEIESWIPNKFILNIGTDWYKNDALFGQYGGMEAEDLLNVWKKTITQITARKIPLAITMGGGYGSEGLALYEQLISWIWQLEVLQVRE